MDSSRYENSQTSKNSFKLRGLKTFINHFSTVLYQKIIQEIPVTEKEITLNMLYQILTTLLKPFAIEYSFFDTEFQQIVGDGTIWNKLDFDQQSAFLIHAFLTAFEQTREELAKNVISLMNSLVLKSNSNNIDYNRNNFGFAFRTREYVAFANEKLFNNGYSRLLDRCNHLLWLAYKKEYIEQSASSSKNIIPSNPLENNTITQKLTSRNPTEILEAINWIENNNQVNYMENLEYLLNHSNQEVMEKAFEVVMKFKGEL